MIDEQIYKKTLEKIGLRGRQNIVFEIVKQIYT